MQAKWGTCGDNGAWCGFNTLNIDSPGFENGEGVYIIWQKQGPVIKVGKGRIKDKIQEDRGTPEILQYPELLVTWATISSEYRSSVHSYLSNKLKPKIPTNVTDASPVAVNLPWPY